jgi:hypothetical protein
MKIKNLIFLALIGVTLSGLTTIVFISAIDREETIRLLDQNGVIVPESYIIASFSEGTILLLLTVGVIGVLGVSRKKKDIDKPAREAEMNKASHNQDLNEHN